MTKLCARGKAAAKRKFKVYPSAYANAYASKICAGKIKDPSGVKRKDFKGPKPASAKDGKFMNDEKVKEVFDDKTKKARFVPIEEIKKNKDRYLPITTKVKNPLKKRFGASNKGSEKSDKMLSVDNVKQLMDAMPKYNVGGHSVMGSPVSVDVDGDTLSNPSASAYYKDLLK
jgi:hypothetical protein